MTDRSRFRTPEAAATAVLPGETVEVDARGDGRWAVVILTRRGVLAFALCTRADEGWIVEGSGEMTDSPIRSTWISLLDDDEPNPNVGVDVAWGTAPPGVNSGVLRGAANEFVVSALNGSYWLVRWEVPDPMENDDYEDDADDFEFASA
jgi:hypothetical protein